ncbi:MAG: DUF1018 domain-containing protein [Pontiellaceae bacterium]|nr:DUF1018 domain-containing protein [Pontiellaceae bacterium]
MSINGTVNPPEMDDRQRKKLFGVAQAAWRASGSPGTFEAWRHEQQALLGVKSLKGAPREMFFKLLHHYMDLLPETSSEGEMPAERDGAEPLAKAHRVVSISNRTDPQIRKVNALLVDQSLSWEYADGIAYRMFKVRRVEWCNAPQLRALISALTKRQQKRGGRRTPPKQELLFPDPVPGPPR